MEWILFETNSREEVCRFGSEIEALAATLDAAVGYRAITTPGGGYHATIYTWSRELAEAWRQRMAALAADATACPNAYPSA